jgi:hypothetical protein
MQHATSKALFGLLCDPGKWKRNVPPKPRLAFTGRDGTHIHSRRCENLKFDREIELIVEEIGLPRERYSMSASQRLSALTRWIIA